MIKKDIFKNLNDEQKGAAISKKGNILVLAGAGTGKTSTIAARVVYLLTELKIDPKDIVLLTFTSKASIEMKERLKSYIQDDIVDSMSISTFHALCLGIVKKHFPEKKLIDANQAKNLLDTSYSRVIKFVPEGFYAPSTLFSYIDNYINSNTEALFSEWLAESVELDEENKDYLLGQYQLVYDSYTEDKGKYNILSFSDLLVLAKTYISSNKNSIQEMIVDEFQDTNPLQNSMIDAINSKSLFCVGDFDQSIYAFNGADLSIIENFKDRENFNLHNLSKNYRCRKPILDIAERVIANNPRIYPKSLEVMISSEDAKAPYCIVAKNPLSQYIEITDLIIEILDSKKENETVAVLYRSNGSGDGIEMTLKEHSVPIERSVKNTFMDNIDIQIVFNILKLIIYKNVEYLEFAILFSGIVQKTSKEAIESYFNMITNNGKVNVIEGLRKDNSRQIGTTGVFHPDAKESVLSLLDLLEFNKYTNVATLINSIMKSKYFINSINRWAAGIAKDDEKAEKLFIGANSRVESMLKLAKRYQDTEKFYTDMTSPRADSEGEGDSNAVNLLTVHASKGLEFDYVFVIDMDDNSFPNKRLMTAGSDDEERRLFYVACTRAKKELVFSYARLSALDVRKLPSRFLIEAGLIESKK